MFAGTDVAHYGTRGCSLQHRLPQPKKTAEAGSIVPAGKLSTGAPLKPPPATPVTSDTELRRRQRSGSRGGGTRVTERQAFGDQMAQHWRCDNSPCLCSRTAKCGSLTAPSSLTSLHIISVFGHESLAFTFTGSCNGGSCGMLCQSSLLPVVWLAPGWSSRGHDGRRLALQSNDGFWFKFRCVIDVSGHGSQSRDPATSRKVQMNDCLSHQAKVQCRRFLSSKLLSFLKLCIPTTRFASVFRVLHVLCCP